MNIDYLISKPKELLYNFIQTDLTTTIPAKSFVILYGTAALLLIIVFYFTKLSFKKETNQSYAKYNGSVDDFDYDDESTKPLKVTKFKKRNLKLPKQMNYDFLV